MQSESIQGECDSIPAVSQPRVLSCCLSVNGDMGKFADSKAIRFLLLTCGGSNPFERSMRIVDPPHLVERQAEKL